MHFALPKTVKVCTRLKELWKVSVIFYSCSVDLHLTKAWSYRFGLAPMVQRDLPYLTSKKTREVMAEEGEVKSSWYAPLLIGRVLQPGKNRQSPKAKKSPEKPGVQSEIPKEDHSKKPGKQRRMLRDFGFERKPSSKAAAVK